MWDGQRREDQCGSVALPQPSPPKHLRFPTGHSTEHEAQLSSSVECLDTANPNTLEAEQAGSLLFLRRTDLGCQCCAWQDSTGALGVIREPQFSCANKAAAPWAMI